MQQAEMADSIRSDRASAGKNDEISAHSFAGLPQRRIMDGRDAINDIHSILSRMRTLLKAAMEACDEASDPKGLWHRGPGWERQRFDQISALIGIAFDQTEAGDFQATLAWDGLIAIERTAA
jgi:hypothetical protein